jgi:hypothetical protein
MTSRNQVAPESDAQDHDAAHAFLNPQQPEAQCSVAELKNAGFSANELRHAGFDFPSLKAIGFTPAQLKSAGFPASAFKVARHELGELRQLGFTAKELKEAGYDFVSLQTAGFDARQLKAAGFSASAFRNNGTGYTLAELKTIGFSAQEIMYPESSPHLSSGLIPAEDPHMANWQQVQEKVASARIFGESWRSCLGFFLPFGTHNSFWSRLKSSSMIRHFFVHDSQFADELLNRTLLDESPTPKVTVTDVDSAVNNCALICALLLSIPTGVISNLSEDAFITMMVSQASREMCRELDLSNLQSTTFSENCIGDFKNRFQFLYNNCIMCFYSSLFTLITAVLYYMCRPSESYNNSSTVMLLKAFTLDVRRAIRQELRSTSAAPEEPFEDRILETEVFMKAKFLAENEAEEQKNQEFYAWYRSTPHSAAARLSPAHPRIIHHFSSLNSIQVFS